MCRGSPPRRPGRGRRRPCGRPQGPPLRRPAGPGRQAERHPPRLLPLRERRLRGGDLPPLLRRRRLAPRGEPPRRRPRRAVLGHEPRARAHRLRRLHARRAGHRPRALRSLAPPRRTREGLGGRGGALRRRVPQGLPHGAPRGPPRDADTGAGHAHPGRLQVGPRPRAAPGARPHRPGAPADRRLRGRRLAVLRARELRPRAARRLLQGEEDRARSRWGWAAPSTRST